jgi:uncharacterized protein (DUF1330 family)
MRDKSLPAFVISEVEILNDAAADEYRRLAATSIAEFGGRYLARGAAAEVVEGSPTQRRIVIVEFPSLLRAREWYASSSYAPALELSRRTLNRRLIFVQGVDSPA